MPLINCKVELKLKWTKFCVLSAGGNDNLNNVFTMKDTQLCSCSNPISKRQPKNVKPF